MRSAWKTLNNNNKISITQDQTTAQRTEQHLEAERVHCNSLSDLQTRRESQPPTMSKQANESSTQYLVEHVLHRRADELLRVPHARPHPDRVVHAARNQDAADNTHNTSPSVNNQ